MVFSHEYPFPQLLDNIDLFRKCWHYTGPFNSKKIFTLIWPIKKVFLFSLNEVSPNPGFEPGYLDPQANLLPIELSLPVNSQLLIFFYLRSNKRK